MQQLCQKKSKHAMKVAIYARTSKKQEQNPENQLKELREYAKINNWEIHKEYVDQISGFKESRPALDNLMCDARLKLFDAVLVWKLDRLGRSLSHLLQIIKEWENKGINFVCKTQAIDTTTSSGKLIFSILGAIANFERDLNQERTKISLDRLKSQGIKLGRPAGSKDKKRRRISGYLMR